LKRKNRVGIKWKLFAHLLSFAAAMLVVLWICQTLLLDPTYRLIQTQQTETVAAAVAEQVDSTELQTFLDRAAANYGMTIRVLYTDRSEVTTSEIPLDSVIHFLTYEEFMGFYERAKANGGTANTVLRAENEQTSLVGSQESGNRYVTDQNVNEHLVHARMAQSSTGGTALVMVACNITPVETTVVTLRYQLLMMTVLMIILAVVVALLMSRQVSKPIVSISDSARQLAGGDYNPQFVGSGYREAEDLAETLNYAARELSKADNLRRELIANVSHDLRTPLTLIAGYAQAMKDLPGENTPQNLQVIIDESDHMSNLVADIMDLSKLQAGTMKIDPRPYSFTESIQRIVRRYSKLLEPRDYGISMEPAPNVWVNADEIKISQVVYNLINNAVNYAGADQHVYVRQTVSGGVVRLEIADTGNGIRPEDLPYIWDRYYKADPRSFTIGTGLGLSIVKNILMLHNAKYGVFSTPGQGSIFWFELPVLDIPQPESPQDALPPNTHEA